MSKKFGWVPPEKRDYSTAKSHAQVLESTKVFGAAAAPISESGKGKVVLLHKVLAKVNGTFPVNNQTIGDCVGHGFAKAVEVLMAVEILLKGEAEQWPGVLTSTEWIYGTSRVLVGGGRLGNSDGSLGSWAAKAVKDHGTLVRKKYDAHDLSRYSGQRARAWGYRDLPTSLETIADEHPVKSTAMVTSYDQARDAIANGYPIPVCSMQGFTSTRDKDGFAKASGEWAHCMLFCSLDDEHKRPGLLCINSWGENWISGPKRHEQPEGSFWVDAEICDRMLQQQDSYALSNFDGYPSQPIDWTQLW